MTGVFITFKSISVGNVDVVYFTAGLLADIEVDFFFLIVLGGILYYIIVAKLKIKLRK